MRLDQGLNQNCVSLCDNNHISKRHFRNKAQARSPPPSTKNAQSLTPQELIAIEALYELLMAKE